MDKEGQTLQVLFETLDEVRRNLHEEKLDLYQKDGYYEETKILDQIEQLLAKADGLASRIGF